MRWKQGKEEENEGKEIEARKRGGKRREGGKEMEARERGGRLVKGGKQNREVTKVRKRAR